VSTLPAPGVVVPPEIFNPPSNTVVPDTCSFAVGVDVPNSKIAGGKQRHLRSTIVGGKEQRRIAVGLKIGHIRKGVKADAGGAVNRLLRQAHTIGFDGGNTGARNGKVIVDFYQSGVGIAEVVAEFCPVAV